MTTPTPDAEAVAALAEAIHKVCEAGWDRRAANGAVAITMHGVDAHRETATIMVPALTAAGWTLSHDSEREALVAALEDMVGLATHGAARDHLDQAGVMQDPPHGWGKYAECEAPWCVRNQKRIAAARAAIEGGR